MRFSFREFGSPVKTRRSQSVKMVPGRVGARNRVGVEGKNLKAAVLFLVPASAKDVGS